MKEYLDPTSRLVYKHHEKDIFSVYVRRSNGKLKLLYCGLMPSKAFPLFHQLKIFKLDRKFLKVTLFNPISNTQKSEVTLLAVSGKDKKPVKTCGGRYSANYSKDSIRNISNVPETLKSEFKARIDGMMDEDNKLITINKAVPFILAYVVSLPTESLISCMKSGEENYLKHVMLSGGDNTYKIKNELLKEQNYEQELSEDDFL